MEIDKKIKEVLSDATIQCLNDHKDDVDIKDFINSLGEKEAKALNIAVSQLGSSFDITRCIGFITRKVN